MSDGKEHRVFNVPFSAPAVQALSRMSSNI